MNMRILLHLDHTFFSHQLEENVPKRLYDIPGAWALSSFLRLQFVNAGPFAIEIMGFTVVDSPKNDANQKVLPI